MACPSYSNLRSILSVFSALETEMARQWDVPNFFRDKMLEFGYYLHTAGVDPVRYSHSIVAFNKSCTRLRVCRGEPGRGPPRLPVTLVTLNLFKRYPSSRRTIPVMYIPEIRFIVGFRMVRIAVSDPIS